MTSTAVRRKALLSSLSGCSTSLKKHVSKKNLLSHSKLPSVSPRSANSWMLPALPARAMMLLMW